MKVLITGATGFLGKGLVEVLSQSGHTLRLLDITPAAGPHECMVGSVADPDTCRQAVTGMDAMVLAHMAPRGTDNINYATPLLPFDVNVKGTANLFHAAVTAGVRVAVVISSTSAVAHHGHSPKDPPVTHDLPPRGIGGIYGLTKALQEVIAEQYAREHGLRVACLRVGYILDGDRNQDKYGRIIGERAPLDTDRRDIAEVARLCLEDQSLRYEVFHVMSTAESMESWDVRYTCTRLGWTPRYDFTWLPESKPKP